MRDAFVCIPHHASDFSIHSRRFVFVFSVAGQPIFAASAVTSEARMARSVLHLAACALQVAASMALTSAKVLPDNAMRSVSRASHRPRNTVGGAHIQPRDDTVEDEDEDEGEDEEGCYDCSDDEDLTEL